MNRQQLLAHVLLLMLLAPPLSAQQPSPAPTPLRDAGDEVVRITTNLVQVDALVTDKDGRVVPDLRAEDFEVLEDGRPQQITNLSFIPLEPALATNAAAALPVRVSKDKHAPPVPLPPARLRPEQVRRTMALVAGNLSFASNDAVHDALKKYVDEQVQPDDLVAIVPLFGRSGALQQFTTDRRQLARAVEKVRWRPASGYDVDDVEPARRDETNKIKPRPGGATSFESAEARATREHIESTFGPGCQHGAGDVVALTYIVRSMRSLPGRKSVVYFSNGLPIGHPGLPDISVCVYNALRRLVDAAARSSVVIYAIDARGLVNQYHISAADDVAPGDTLALRENRARDFWESQNGLNYMAENTGGRFIHSNNDLNQALGRVMSDQRGYYLIGYRPTEATFKGKRFHSIKVRVRRPGLSVRSRSGFYSLPDGEASAPMPSGGDRQLYAALASPVGGADVRMQLITFFGNDPRAGSYVRALLHINAQDLIFTDEPKGFKKAVFDVAAVTFGEDGRIADEFNRTHTVRVSPDTFRHILLHGLSYSADVPVKRAGAYQLRIVVRDAASHRMGTSGQFVEVPDVGKKQFALSGLVVGEADAQGGAPTLPPGATAEAAISPVPSGTDLSLRRFRPATVLAYSYVIYNPRLDKTTRRPQLTTQARLFQAGRQVLTSPETPFEPGAQTDPARLAAGGTLRLPPDAAPGEYVLQIVVTDQLAKPKDRERITTQWIDFEITKTVTSDK